MDAISGFIQVITTTASREDAQKIAAELVRQQLAACVQISGPITSTYRWRGNVETSEEWQCTIKTRGELFKAVDETIRRLHTYEVPEIIALPIVAGSSDYLNWLNEST